MLDIKTLLLINLIVNLISLATTMIIWRQYRSRFVGLSYWNAYMVFQVLGIGLNVLPGLMSDVLASLLSNLFILSGALLMLMGLERFTGKTGSHFHNFGLLAVFTLAFSYFAAQSNLTMRSISVAFTIIVIESQIFWLMLKRVPPELRGATRLTAIVAGGYVVVSLVRIILLLAFPIETNDFFHTGAANALAIMAYLALQICLVIALVLMVTHRLLAEIQVEEEKFTKAFHSSPYAIMITRLSDGKILEVNDGFIHITGYTKQQTLGKTTLDINLLDETDRVAFIKQLSANKMVKDREIQFSRNTGETRTGLIYADIIAINNEACILSSISDITEQSEMRKKLQEMATHDALTGLPNRRLFYDRFELALANARRKEHLMALFSIDLDKFKMINDTYGHAIGDQTLIEAARRLTDCSRKVDTLARFGGDEFLLLLWEIHSKEEASAIAERILKAFREPWMVDGHPIQFSVSIGISFYPEHGEDIQTLIKISDDAMYLSKERGRGSYIAA